MQRLDAPRLSREQQTVRLPHGGRAPPNAACTGLNSVNSVSSSARSGGRSDSIGGKPSVPIAAARRVVRAAHDRLRNCVLYGASKNGNCEVKNRANCVSCRPDSGRNCVTES